MGGHGPRRWGRGLPRRLHFVKFVCQNERTGSFRGVRRVRPPGSASEKENYHLFSVNYGWIRRTLHKFSVSRFILLVDFQKH